MYTPAGHSEGRPKSRRGIQGGLQVGFGHFAVGFSGAYYQDYAHDGLSRPTPRRAKDDGYVVTAGGSYTIDAWSVGLQGIYAHYNQSPSVVGGLLGCPSAASMPSSCMGLAQRRLRSRAWHLARGPDCLDEGRLRQSESASGGSEFVADAVGVDANRSSIPGSSTSAPRSTSRRPQDRRRNVLADDKVAEARADLHLRRVAQDKR